MSDSEQTRARLVGINHVALEVGDVGEALDFYEALFEFELRSRSDRAAFLDMGDQFLALAETETAEGRDDHRHFGLVVDDPGRVEEGLADLDADRPDAPGVEFYDPWGNRVQVVAYDEVQFTKASHVLDGMDLSLEKSDAALAELEEKGLDPE